MREGLSTRLNFETGAVAPGSAGARSYGMRKWWPRMRRFWADMKSSDFQNIEPDTVAILPIGAIEQHGPHLPVSVDRDLVNAVALRVLDHIEPEQNV